MSEAPRARTSRPTLSVCIVTQDMAHFLPYCLASVEDLADEIVVVDSYSKDETAENLRGRPKVRFLQRRFEGHFGEQKNYAIDQCTSDWVLVIDSDEVLGDRLRQILPKLLRSPTYTHYKLARYWLIDGPEWTYARSPRHYPDFQLRLFRNLPVFRYSLDKVVHTHFPREGRGKGKKLRDCHLFHFDFLLKGREAREAKFERYLRLEPASHETSRMYLYEEFEPRALFCREPLTSIDLDLAQVHALREAHGYSNQVRSAKV